MPDPSWSREYQDGEVVPGTPYRVVRLMGAGGMGSVYEVEHVELGRHYVLKSLLSTLTSREDLTARMRNEWKALGQVSHENIVDVLNAGLTASGVPYYVMELLVGETVRERLEREGRIDIGDAVRIARGVLGGLEAAHAVDIVHRDVKPANVFLTADGEVKLLDFGIAKVHLDGAPKITVQGLAVGTPRYMSPEQAAGEKADARSDVYAVGLLLFEMVAGRGPFEEASEHAAQMDAHLNLPPPKLERFVTVPPGLSEVVASALAKRPAERPPSARAMAEMLAPFEDRRGSGRAEELGGTRFISTRPASISATSHDPLKPAEQRTLPRPEPWTRATIAGAVGIALGIVALSTGVAWETGKDAARTARTKTALQPVSETSSVAVEAEAGSEAPVSSTVAPASSAEAVEAMRGAAGERSPTEGRTDAGRPRAGKRDAPELASPDWSDILAPTSSASERKREPTRKLKLPF